MTHVDVVEVGAERAAEVLTLIRAGFGARKVLDPPSTAMDETVDSVAEALAAHGGLITLVEDAPVGALIFDPRDDELGRQLGVRRVSVHPDAQTGGIATVMAAEAEHVAARRGYDGVRLAARTELPATVRFWRNRGYSTVAIAGTTMTLGKELPFEVEAPTVDAMQEFAASLAGHLRAGDLLILDGGLGAGKTTFTQGLGRGLGVTGAVASPTFVIARVHPSASDGPTLVHVDAYRLGEVAELDDLDLDTDLDEAVTVIEWGSGMAEGLAEDRLLIRISRTLGSEADADERRRVRVVPAGARWVGSGLRSAISPA